MNKFLYTRCLSCNVFEQESREISFSVCQSLTLFPIKKRLLSEPLPNKRNHYLFKGGYRCCYFTKTIFLVLMKSFPFALAIILKKYVPLDIILALSSIVWYPACLDSFTSVFISLPVIS